MAAHGDGDGSLPPTPVSPLSPSSRSSPSAALLGVDVTDTMRRLCNGKLSVSIHANKDVLFDVPQPGPISTPHAWAGGRSGGTRKLVVALTLFGHASQRTFLHGATCPAYVTLTCPGPLRAHVVGLES